MGLHKSFSYLLLFVVHVLVDFLEEIQDVDIDIRVVFVKSQFLPYGAAGVVIAPTVEV